jgi:hypothetical protein
MVTKLQQKVKELNDMTKKLQKEVDRLKEQLQRRRWPMPFGDSWDSDSMYNFLTGSSYSDDQDSDTSSRDYHSSRVNNNPPSTTSTTLLCLLLLFSSDIPGNGIKVLTGGAA